MPSTNPRPDNQRSERLEARITRRQKALFRKAAEIQGRTVSDFVVQAASDAAAKVVQASELIMLGERDSKLFVKALLNPGKPNKALRQAAAKYNEMTRRKREQA